MNAKVSKQMPSRVDSHRPYDKAHVHAASRSKQSQRLQSVAEGLPSGLGTAEKSSIADDLLIALGDVVDDEVSMRVLVYINHNVNKNLAGRKTHENR